MPRSDELLDGPTHAVCIDDHDPSRRLLRFLNSWGPNWGDDGYGYLPYDYYDRYAFDSWLPYLGPDLLHAFRHQRVGGPDRTRWSGIDRLDYRLYGFDVHDDRARERHAWAFVVERDGALEVEELYVRPEFRRQGYGGWLAAQIVELARTKNLPLRVWTHFADCRQESPENYGGLVATARRLGVQFHRCPVRWAAYLATNERAGSLVPVEPDFIPARPRSTLGDVLKVATMATSLTTGANGTHTTPPPSPVVESTPTSVEVGTPEWDRLTRRRAELIYKKNRAGLSDAERSEFDRLQRLDAEAIARRFPRPRLTPEERAVLRDALGPAADAYGL